MPLFMYGKIIKVTPGFNLKERKNHLVALPTEISKTIESWDNRVVRDSIIPRDRLENFHSLGHTYSYPRSLLQKNIISPLLKCFQRCQKIRKTPLNI